MSNPYIDADLLGLSLYHDSNTGNFRYARGIQVPVTKELAALGTYYLSAGTTAYHFLSSNSNIDVAAPDTAPGGTMYIIKNKTASFVYTIKHLGTVVGHISGGKTASIVLDSGEWEFLAA